MKRYDIYVWVGIIGMIGSYVLYLIYNQKIFGTIFLYCVGYITALTLLYKSYRRDKEIEIKQMVDWIA